jgi:hypothetical protein
MTTSAAAACASSATPIALRSSCASFRDAFLAALRACFRSCGVSSTEEAGRSLSPSSPLFFFLRLPLRTSAFSASCEPYIGCSIVMSAFSKSEAVLCPSQLSPSGEFFKGFEGESLDPEAGSPVVVTSMAGRGRFRIRSVSSSPALLVDCDDGVPPLAVTVCEAGEGS